jgi:hypothetical protein
MQKDRQILTDIKKNGQKEGHIKKNSQKEEQTVRKKDK